MAFTFFLLPNVGQAQFVDAAKALEIEKKYLNRRYDGYFRHVEAYKKYQKLRVKKVQEHKIRRVQFEKEQEARRKAFISKRKKRKKVVVDIDAIVAKQQKERDRMRNKKRKMFIKNRDIMNKLKNTSKRIPVDIDVGLKSLRQEMMK